MLIWIKLMPLKVTLNDCFKFVNFSYFMNDFYLDQMSKKFNYSEIKMEAAWEYLRTSFNKKLGEMRKKLNKK